MRRVPDIQRSFQRGGLPVARANGTGGRFALRIRAARMGAVIWPAMALRRALALCVLALIGLSWRSLAGAPPSDGAPRAGAPADKDAAAPDSAARAGTARDRALHNRRAELSQLLAIMDERLARRQPALALQEALHAERAYGPRPELAQRMAAARFELGQALGETQIREIPGGRAGQFAGSWLLLEPVDQTAAAREIRDESTVRSTERFLCCPRESALYCVRRALDAGLDDPALHLLHARIWDQAGRSVMALAVLRAHEAEILPQIAERQSANARGAEIQSAAIPATEARSAAAATVADAERAAACWEIAWQIAARAHDAAALLHYAGGLARLRPAQAGQVRARTCALVAGWYAAHGDVRSCAAFLTRAHLAAPEDAAILRRLGDAEAAVGRPGEAATCYRRVLELDPATEARGELLRRIRAMGEK